MVRVRPGVELTWASFCPSRELIRLDLPTLERPRKANSGGPGTGKARGSAAEVMNLAWTDFIRSLFLKPRSVARGPYKREAARGSRNLSSFECACDCLRFSWL